jgi:enoyl-[acyl-carrier protein] reductase II
VIAAGGIANGRQLLAAMVLGAEGVQMGSRFVCSDEASSHINFKEAVIKAQEGDTMLSLKKIMPVRMMKNQFFNEAQEAELRGATEEELRALLGKGRSRIGMFEGDLENGELEIGEVSALIKDIQPAGEIVKNVWQEFQEALKNPLS